MQYTIFYYLKTQHKQTKTFDTLEKAQAFFVKMLKNPACEACGFDNRNY